MENKPSSAIIGAGAPGRCRTIELPQARQAGQTLGQRMASAFQRN